MTTSTSSAVPDLVIRPLAGPEELDLFLRLTYSLDHELADDLATGRRLPEWMWVALDGDRLLGRIAWWTNKAGGEPLALDFFDLTPELSGLSEDERAEIGLRLLETATAAVVPAGTQRPEFGRFMPADWREVPETRSVLESLFAVLERTGARPLVERLRLEWRPGTSVPEPKGRLEFRPVRDREDLVALMTPVMEGTLDAHGQADLATGLSAREAAELHYDEELAHYTSPQEWWQVAQLPESGEPVGFVIPARNNYHHTIAYIGVLPAHRGNGYIDDILAEGTRILAATDVPRIRAATDLANVPMAAAFARAGYVTFERAINYVWDAPGASES
ncbi:GNAT family N-acetyltransferase [Streptomyces sp. NBC_00094]|uniref:GNAT family N-acetyltransferase n=1 Tax=Streptomyces sp. NBC_00094 TaxID=2903620 RepID=UPI00225625A1|nr:GNAT family N-acetyltransferase [Streptomyces sp. NBC_00094]MCX5393873.1 GNAT family N-acetyltransferase [Streptomyces sp. NBC_00094]